MAGIGIGGLGSGLDTNAIISQLVKLETIPINQLAGKKAVEQDKLAKIGEFKNLVKDLQSKAKQLEMIAGLQRCSDSCSDAMRLQALALHAEINRNAVVFRCHLAFLIPYERKE